MLELSLDTQRGSLHLQMECSLASDWTVVFGPSGAGKSTLLRLLAGLDRPDSGHVVLDGQKLTHTSQGIHIDPGRRRTALVAQQPALFPHMTVTGNVSYGISQLDSATRAARLDEMLDLVDARNLAPRRPRSLSGGEAQRVALARALAPLPRLLLLDEPFAALDGTASDALLSRLQAWLHEHSVQTILVTHDATDAYATNAEVLLMREGKLAAVGSASEALARERARIIGRLTAKDLRF